MTLMGRLCVALAVPLVLSAAAQAQVGGASLVGQSGTGPDSVLVRAGLPDARMPRGDLRDVGRPSPNRLIAALPVAANLQVGVGRFGVPELAGPRTNMETERRPADIRRRDRGIAAVGLSLRF